MKLTICLATYKRAGFIGETLDSIVSQLRPGVEVVIVDGNSPDETESVVAGYVERYPQVRYFRESTNSGVDADYDKAVGYATGEFCWLMTDDDVLLPGAVSSVVERMEADGSLDLIVVNAEVRDCRLDALLEERLLAVNEDRRYHRGDADAMFAELSRHLKFIGSVIVRRSRWMERDRRSYYGSLFIHFGAIFQHPPLEECLAISRPVMAIRYGNAMWSARGFEIWMFLWPRLVWSFAGIQDASKARVSSKKPWRSVTKLGMHRATGGYTMAEYRRFFGDSIPRGQRMLPRVIATIPVKWVNAMASIYCVLLFRSARLNMYDLLRSRGSNWVTRIAARIVGV